jgi:Grx4 family monothiol glutaredoxin
MTTEITTFEVFEDEILTPSVHADVVHFATSWAAPCAQVDQVLSTLYNDPNITKNKTGLRMWKVDAEKNNHIAKEARVSQVPTVVFYRLGREVSRLEGADVPQLVKTYQSFVDSVMASKMSTRERLERLISKDEVVLFMKGSPDAPRCGFSRQIVELLKNEGVQMSTVDVLQDEEVRWGLKEVSGWPTFPQLFVKGKLVGGLDIVREMIEEGEFAELLDQ